MTSSILPEEDDAIFTHIHTNMDLLGFLLLVHALYTKNVSQK